MDSQTTLRYHTQAFQVLSREAHMSEQAVQTITQHEAEHGLRVPASVREFYAHEGDKLDLGDSNWRIVSLKEFLGDFTHPERSRFRSNPGLSGEQEFVILSYPFCNMDFQVYMVLDGLDDPWVQDNMALSLPGPFSAFILNQAWDRITPRTFRILARSWANPDHAVWFGPSQLEFLREEFESQPNIRGGPGQPGLFTFAFFRPGWRVEIEAKGDPRLASCPAEYLLCADTAERLLDLYAFAWPAHGGPVVFTSAGPDLDLLKKQFGARFGGVEVFDTALKLDRLPEPERQAALEERRLIEQWIHSRARKDRQEGGI